MKKTIGYTIKSTSDEGVYFLVNHWEKNKTFWVKREQLKEDMLFKTSGYAQRSLKHLLEVMEDYKTDEFDLVEVYELKTELETVVIVAEIESISIN